MDRRHIIFSGAASLAATKPGSSQPSRRGSRITQQELDEAIRLHRMWLVDNGTGQRCMFGGRNLSGLQFGELGGDPVDLSGADFAQTNLSDTEADDILVDHWNLIGAAFDGCRWRRPVFAYADMRRASAKGVEWGTPGLRDSDERSPADFSHVVLFNANLDQSRICGFFYGTKLRDASLEEADWSYSDFSGPKYYEMSFSGARLARAQLRHCDVSSVTFFNADCSGTDFSDTVFSDVRMKGCNLTGASFQRAEIDPAMFSSDQIDYRRVGTDIGKHTTESISIKLNMNFKK